MSEKEYVAYWLETEGNTAHNEHGCWVESVRMVGGKYIMFTADHEVWGLTDDFDEAYEFLVDPEAAALKHHAMEHKELMRLMNSI